VEVSIPVRQEVVEWLLDTGKLYRRAHSDDQLVIFRKLWAAREEHEEVQVACQALGTKVDGTLGELFQVLGVPPGEGQRDPFSESKDPLKEDIPKLLSRARKGSLIERTRAHVRFLRALAAQEEDQPAALERLEERHRRHAWLTSGLEALKRWDDLVGAQSRLERDGLIPAHPAEPFGEALRVRVFTGAFEQPEGGTPHPVTVDGWLLEDGDDAVTVYTDFLETRTYELGLANVPLDMLQHAGGPLPRLEELDLEAAAYERLGGGIKSYAEQPRRRSAGSLTYGQETLLQALYLWRAGRRGLAVRLFELADAVHQRDTDRAAGIGLTDGYAVEARTRDVR
jgi:hypothetical protein